MLELTEDELRLLQSALHSYLDDFGHEEADVLRQIKELIARLPDRRRPRRVRRRLRCRLQDARALHVRPSEMTGRTACVQR
jgi:hypothetical protein